MPFDPSIISAGVGAVASGISSLFGHKKSGHTDPSGLSNSTGGDILNFLSDAIKNKNLNFSTLVDKLSTLAKDKGYYANSALSYYLENEAFEKQLNYNTMAMEKQFQYQNASMKKQFAYDVNMQNRSYEMSRNLQNEQNAWSKMMSDTSHQREVADLRSAGLNPILSANSGANAYTSGSAIIGGNTPSPSNPSALPISKPDYGNVIDAIVKGQQVRNETKVANAQAEKILKEAQNLDWTPEGIKRNSANFTKDIIDDFTDDKPFDFSLGSVKGLVDKFNKEFEGNNAESSFNTSNNAKNLFKLAVEYVDDLTGGRASEIKSDIGRVFSNSYKTFDKKGKYVGDVVDIDKYIRSKYNVNRKVKAHR